MKKPDDKAGPVALSILAHGREDCRIRVRAEPLTSGAAPLGAVPKGLRDRARHPFRAFYRGVAGLPRSKG